MTDFQKTVELTLCLEPPDMLLSFSSLQKCMLCWTLQISIGDNK